MCVNKLRGGGRSPLNFVDWTMITIWGREKFLLQNWFCQQTALLSASYDNIILEAKKLVSFELDFALLTVTGEEGDISIFLSKYISITA